MNIIRCEWAGRDPLYQEYHDKEWGVPVFDNRRLFEFLILEGAQAGLSWITILKKRENYRRLFDQFDPHKIVNYNGLKIKSLMQDSGIVRNRLKIESVIRNAEIYLRIEQREQSFSHFIWSFVHGKPLINCWQNLNEVPVKTEVSDKMSKSLKKEGFTFVGSTICYAFMQAVGMVNDHICDCFRYQEILEIIERS